MAQTLRTAPLEFPQKAGAAFHGKHNLREGTYGIPAEKLHHMRVGDQINFVEVAQRQRTGRLPRTFFERLVAAISYTRI